MLGYRISYTLTQREGLTSPDTIGGVKGNSLEVYPFFARSTWSFALPSVTFLSSCDGFTYFVPKKKSLHDGNFPGSTVDCRELLIEFDQKLDRTPKNFTVDRKNFLDLANSAPTTKLGLDSNNFSMNHKNHLLKNVAGNKNVWPEIQKSFPGRLKIISCHGKILAKSRKARRR